VRVGSTNGPKLEAVRGALAPYLPELSVSGVAVASGVPDQPVGFDEIVAGARNRARAALDHGECDLGVGLEDGLVEIPAAGPHAMNVGCAALTDGRRVALGFSAGFAYPPACADEAVARRAPIGELFDALWDRARGEGGATPSALGLGNVGRLTQGVLPRAEYARHAVVCAFVQLLHPDLYPPEGAA
jgi:inosine/xanthosine triphosphatase